jgi:adenylate kinase family enzyme
MRINIIGTAGSGKSTFSKQIAEKLKIPYIELEALAWKSNWTEVTDEELFSKLERHLSSDDWVLDGNYPQTLHIKWKKCQMVVYLDMPFHIIFYRLLRRTLIRIFTGEELWAGNKETFWRQFFTRDSVIWWGLSNFFPKRRYYLIDSMNPKYSHIKFVRLRSKKDIKDFVKHKLHTV